MSASTRRQERTITVDTQALGAIRVRRISLGGMARIAERMRAEGSHDETALGEALVAEVVVAGLEGRGGAGTGEAADDASGAAGEDLAARLARLSDEDRRSIAAAVLTLEGVKGAGDGVFEDPRATLARRYSHVLETRRDHETPAQAAPDSGAGHGPAAAPQGEDPGAGQIALFENLQPPRPPPPPRRAPASRHARRRPRARRRPGKANGRACRPRSPISRHCSLDRPSSATHWRRASGRRASRCVTRSGWRADSAGWPRQPSRWWWWSQARSSSGSACSGAMSPSSARSSKPGCRRSSRRSKRRSARRRRPTPARNGSRRRARPRRRSRARRPRARRRRNRRPGAPRPPSPRPRSRRRPRHRAPARRASPDRVQPLRSLASLTSRIAASGSASPSSVVVIIRSPSCE